MIEQASGAALRGLDAALASEAKHAEQLANFDRGNGDIVTPLIGLKLDAVQVQASAAVIRAEEETSRAVLNILA